MEIASDTQREPNYPAYTTGQLVFARRQQAQFAYKMLFGAALSGAGGAFNLGVTIYKHMKGIYLPDVHMQQNDDGFGIGSGIGGALGVTMALYLAREGFRQRRLITQELTVRRSQPATEQ